MDSGQGFGTLSELTEVPGAGVEALQNSQKVRVLYGSLEKLTGVPGGYVNVVLPAPRYFTKCRVPGILVAIPYFPGIYPTRRPGAGMG